MVRGTSAGSSYDAVPPSFESYVAARRTSLRRTAYLLCGDWDRAEDVVQDALARLFVHWRRVQRSTSVDAYCRKAVVNAFLAEKRRPWRRERSTEAVPEREYADPTAVSDQRQALLRALDELPPGQRAIVVLRYWDDLSVEETAALLDTSTGNVKSQASRGLARLREVLAATEVDHG
ncbi:MAG TPA: SigE family RNA polymerase sigma factor [Candidatus Nanopelagicales bacterium]|nr:SigE family RNA polymerase sigma factor [Candidatus Nanopelagicales bacterium]